MAETGIGASVKRTEDYRFLTGAGRYTDDINRPGQAYAYFVRSLHAHATVNGINKDAAQAAPGVVAVLTGDDLAADGVGGIPCGFCPAPGPMNEPPRPALAQGKVRFVGDMVAVVIAETLAQAKDAAELVDVDYGTLPVAVSLEDAAQEGAPQLHDAVLDPSNVCAMVDDLHRCQPAVAAARGDRRRVAVGGHVDAEHHVEAAIGEDFRKRFLPGEAVFQIGKI